MANLIDNDALDLGEIFSGYGQPGVVMNSSIAAIFSAQVNSSGYLEIYKSTDDGGSWSLDTTFTDSVNIKMFSFASSPRGDIFVAFSYETSTDVYTIKVKKKAYDTGSWSEILSETALNSTTYPIKPLITWNRYETSRLHIFWMEHASGNSYGDISNKYTDNYGSSWTNGASYPHTESSGNFSYTIDCIDTDPTTGTVWVYHRLVEVGWRLREQSFTSVGAAGGITDLPSSTNRRHRGSSVVIDSTGNRWVLLYYRHSTNDEHWVEVIDRLGSYDITLLSSSFTGQPVYGGMVCIGKDNSDDIYAFYVKTSDNKCYYYKFDAATSTWGTETVLTSGDGLRPACIQKEDTGSSRFYITFYTN